MPAKQETEADLKLRLEPVPGEPSRYQVVMLNDDFTPMHFAVGVFQNVFHKPPSDAEATMWEIYSKGKAVCGIYPTKLPKQRWKKWWGLRGASSILGFVVKFAAKPSLFYTLSF